MIRTGSRQLEQVSISKPKIRGCASLRANA